MENLTSFSGLAVGIIMVVPLLSVMTIVSNVLLIIVILRTPVLHTKTNAMLISMSTSEIITAVTCMPIFTLIHLYGDWALSSQACAFFGFCDNMVSSSKALGLMIVSFDRCTAVSRPLQYNNIISKPMTMTMVAFVWCQSVIFALFPVFGWGTYTFEESVGCMFDLSDSSGYPYASIIFCVFIPCLVVDICLIKIIVEAKSHHRVLAIAQLPVAMYSGMSSVNYTRTTLKAMKVFLIISTAFMCLCLPRYIYILLLILNQTPSLSIVWTTFMLLHFCCSVTNPVVITFYNSKFKQSARSLFKWNRNRVRPARERELFTISTGLQSVLEASIAIHTTHTIYSEDANLNTPQLFLTSRVSFKNAGAPNNPGPSSSNIPENQTKSNQSKNTLHVGFNFSLNVERRT